MTEESKNTLLDYLIGNLPKQKGLDEEIFEEINEISRNEWQPFLPNGWHTFKFEGIISLNNSSDMLLYGGYKVYQSLEVRGIIMILDNNFKPKKTIYQYDNGTYLRYIQCLRQADDSTFYMVDCTDFPTDTEWTFTTSEKRFVMINNFTESEKNPSLRISYKFSDAYQNFYCYKLYKDLNSSKYVMVGRYLRNQNSPDFDGIRIIELKVNVGEANEWKKYDDNGEGWLLGDCYVEFDKNNNALIETIITDTSASNTKVYSWIKKFTDISFKLNTILSRDYSSVKIDSYSYNNQCVFLNKDEVYFILNNQNWGIPGKKESKYIELYYYNFQTNKEKLIYSNYLGEYDFIDKEAIYITQNQNELYIQFNPNIDYNKHIADYYFQRFNGRWNPQLVGKEKNFYYSLRALYVKNDYNLLRYFAYMTSPHVTYWTTYDIKEIYNPSNFNGEKYTNETSLIPRSSLLYCDNSLVFARNLYNSLTQGNSTIASVEIPNNYLNNVVVNQSKLIGKTKLELINSAKNIEKNIYETVDINFIHNLNITDENNPDNKIVNKSASVYLNNAINSENSYDKAKATKYRINYQDNTSIIEKIKAERIMQTDKLAYQYTIGIYVPKLINNIQIISEDEQNIYLTIDCTNLEQDKSYKIIQNVEVI